MMKSLTAWVLGTFASPVGVLILAVLDSTLFFSLPFGIDAAVIVLAARSDTLAWAVPLVATAGTAAGAALTFWMGRKAGEQGLERYMNPRRLERVRERVRHSGAIALALLNLVPPPFPFTPVVLAAGALEVNTLTFFSTLVATRLLRFGVEAYLATRFGRRILEWLESDTVQAVVIGCMVVGLALTASTLWTFVRRGQTSRTGAAT